MSDLTTLDAVKKAAERARAKMLRTQQELIRRGRQNRPEYLVACAAEGAMIAFSQELEVAMRNPREEEGT